MPRAVTPRSNTLTPGPLSRGERGARGDCDLRNLGHGLRAESRAGERATIDCGLRRSIASGRAVSARGCRTGFGLGREAVVVHPPGQAADTLSEQQNDEIRREIFVRLSHSDFRSLSHGSQFRYLDNGLTPLLDGTLVEQVPNLVIAPRV